MAETCKLPQNEEDWKGESFSKHLFLGCMIGWWYQHYFGILES